jgi:type III restriction enzyme
MKYQPGSEEIITRELQSGVQRILSTGTANYREKYIENHIVSLLMDKQEIWYDEHKDLLYKLANQAVNHFKSYLADDKEVLNVILTFKIPIAEQIYQQMMVNYEIVHDGFEKPVMTVRPCSEIKDPAISKNVGERIYDYKENIEPVSQIRNKVFGGFTKALHNLYKFDSKTEKDFASILEQDRNCLKWLRPAKSQFQIYYGHPSREYMPDFVVETSEFIALVETKKKDDVETETVKSKAKAALNYCMNATEYNKQIGGKPWKYILIPHDSVKLNMGLEYLFNQFEVTD